MKELSKLYNEWAGRAPVLCQPITGSGSNRQYFRLSDADGQSVIGVVGTCYEENQAFLYLSQHFADCGLPVPQILRESPDGMRYLQTDLGGQSLYDALKSGRESGDYSVEERELIRRIIRLLPTIQLKGAEGLDFNRCYPQAEMDETNVRFDLNYFKYCILKPSDVEFHELRLEQSFTALTASLSHGMQQGFMYRDFQARNIMLDAEGNPHLIDYQGGRRGPIHYDLASFLWQASARYPEELRWQMVDEYLDALRQYVEVDEDEFRRQLLRMVLFRQLQVLGAYGFLGLVKRKKYFLDSIPHAIRNVKRLLEQGACADAYLADVLTRLVEHYMPAENPANAQPSVSKYDGKGPLRVRVFSFSYKKGIPADESGNGGGYVFDCRSTHNPGRYQPYKQLTGLDRSVIDFLEKDGEILTFLESVDKLADAHVERYISRGFTDLMFSFGCTGGQHRSVYSAQHVAEHLNNKYGIEVELFHREQNIRQVLPAHPVRPWGRKVMIFAAGMGTRLKPLTDVIPKALVPVGGKPLLQIQVEKMQAAGFEDLVVNIHHHADQVENWCKGRGRIALSDERAGLLDTGGGIRHALPLLEDADRFLIHNVDILSNMDLEAFWQQGAEAEACLLVSERQTQRYLLFNEEMRLVGWTNVVTGEVKTPFPSLDVAKCRRLAFAGIHQMHTALAREMEQWPDRFSIIDFYLSVCATHDIRGYVQPGLRLLDVGKLDTLAKAEELQGVIS